MIKLCSVVCLKLFNGLYSASQTRTCTKVKIKLTTKSWQKLHADNFRLKENREMQRVDGRMFDVGIPTQTWSLNCQVLNTYEHALQMLNIEKSPHLAFHVHNKTSLFKLYITQQELADCAKSLQGEAPCGGAVYGKVDEMSPAPSPLNPLPLP